MSRNKHPTKEIEKAILYAKTKGWTYKKVGRSAHARGQLLCPLHTQDGCAMSIWSTPKNTWHHAMQIKNDVLLHKYHLKVKYHERNK